MLTFPAHAAEFQPGSPVGGRAQGHKYEALAAANRGDWRNGLAEGARTATDPRFRESVDSAI